MPEPTDVLLFERLLARTDPLSAEGLARRTAMRGELVAAVGRRRRQRRALRATLIAAALALAVGVTLSRAFSRAPRQPTSMPALAHTDFATVRDDATRAAQWRVSPALDPGVLRASGTPLTRLEFARAASDAGAVAAWFVPTRNLPAGTLADDTEILRLLADAGRETGLVRSASGVVFTADVFGALDAQ